MNKGQSEMLVRSLDLLIDQLSAGMATSRNDDERAMLVSRLNEALALRGRLTYQGGMTRTQVMAAVIGIEAEMRELATAACATEGLDPSPVEVLKTSARALRYYIERWSSQ